ncbi:MAG: hypothetical protein LBS50_04810 [Prevotellaceae bacterium]|jgi:hypothetical protein|nr:hypothetical protein [Prevotellaceae bacterium]
MKKIIAIFLFSVLCTFSFSQSKIANRWAIEPFAAFGIESEFSLMGLEYGVQTNYSILDRLGAQISLGSFQSLQKQYSWQRANSSYMLVSLDIFGDLLRTKKGHRIRLSAGGTYFKGDLAYASWYINTSDTNPDAFKPFFYKLRLYNNIGLNVKLSYLCPLTDKWQLGINLKGYDIIDGMFLHILSVGCSAVYTF